MRVLSILVALGFLSTNPVLTQAAPVRKVVPKGSVSFTAKSQKFAVWLPKKPIEEDDFRSLKNGEKGRTFSFDVLTTEVSYSITSTEKAPISPKSRRIGLDELQLNVVRSWGGTLQKRQDLKLATFAGRELTLKSEFDNPARVRLFDTPRFRYMIFARSDKALTPNQNAQINRVFDSFRILK